MPDLKTMYATVQEIQKRDHDKTKVPAGGKTNSGSGAAKSSSTGDEKTDRKPKPPKDKGSIECWTCRKTGHMSRYCSQKVEKDIDTAIKDELDETDDEPSRPRVGFKSKKGRGKHVTFTVCVAQVKKLPAYSKWLVVLDTGANVSCVYNKELLTCKRPNSDPEEISTVDGGLFTPKWEGDFKDFDVLVKYDPSFEANILSFSMVVDATDSVIYDKFFDQYEVSEGDIQYVFERYNGVYVCDFSPKLSIFVMTAEQNEKQFTPREVKAARGVRELMRIRGLDSSDQELKHTQLPVHRARCFACAQDLRV
jgi:hypothetical protein